MATGTGIGVGIALAAGPVQAQHQVTTNAEGLTAGPVWVSTADGRPMPAYRAMPATGSGFGTVLVVQEIFGVHAYIADICRRFAKAGYCAVAPELYFRQGDPRYYTDIPTMIKDIVAKVPDEQVMKDLDATRAMAAVRAARLTAPIVSITNMRAAWAISTSATAATASPRNFPKAPTTTSPWNSLTCRAVSWAPPIPVS